MSTPALPFTFNPAQQSALGTPRFHRALLATGLALFVLAAALTLWSMKAGQPPALATQRPRATLGRALAATVELLLPVTQTFATIVYGRDQSWIRRARIWLAVVDGIRVIRFFESADDALDRTRL